MHRVCLSRSEQLDALIVLGVAALGLGAVFAPERLLAVTPPCLVTAITGHQCWGCGITHAIIAAAAGDLVAAWVSNKLVVVVLPLLLVVYLRLLMRVGRAILRVFGKVRSSYP